jgi:hypothetical protein
VTARKYGGRSSFEARQLRAPQDDEENLAGMPLGTTERSLLQFEIKGILPAAAFLAVYS